MVLNSGLFFLETRGPGPYNRGMVIGLPRGNGRRPDHPVELVEGERMADERQAQAENPAEAAHVAATATVEKRTQTPQEAQAAAPL